MKALIMAGGFGTRIQSVSNNVPKPLIKVDNVPVLERTIIQLSKYSIDEIIITVSYLKEAIIEYFGDGHRLGVKIEYFTEDKPLGSAGAIFKLKDRLKGDFLVLNGDIVFDVDLDRMINFHKSNNSLITAFAHPNTHPYDSTLLDCGRDNIVQRVYRYSDKAEYYKNCVNAGIHIINSDVFELLADGSDEKKNFDKDIIIPALESNRVFAYISPEYVKDMGTPDRLEAVERDLRNGKVARRNLSNKQKAIFLDRDGTVNKYVGFLTDIEELRLIDNVAKAIKQINESDYLAIIITNQPVIARGDMTFDELDRVHNKLETLLGNEGAYLDGIYFCPHHTDKGFEGERPELKFDCDCRKPKTGLFLKAKEDFNIDLTKSYMIGDSDIDVMAGNNAGCKSIKINDAENFWKQFDILLLDYKLN